MSRHEAEREDLMAQATALRERIEYFVVGQPEPIVAGFRAGGQWSLYFGSDPVYHFAAEGALRRAFVGNDLFRSQGQTLSRLRRERIVNTANEVQEVQLVRHDLTADEWEQFATRMQKLLIGLKIAIEAGSAQISRQVPEDAGLEAKLLAALQEAARPRLAGAMNRGGRKAHDDH